MMFKVMTEEEKNIIVRVEDDIRVMQTILWDNEILYDEDDFELNRATEALLYGAYHDDIGYIMSGLDILKEFIQRVEDFEFEDYNFFEGCIAALQKVVDKHARK